jgi:hypothetical protein
MTNAPGVPGAPRVPAAFTAEQQQQIVAARVRAGKVRRSVRVAWFDAVCTALCAATTLMAGVVMSFDLLSLLIGLAMAGVAYNSFRGAGELQRYEIKGAKRLGWNQIAFCTIICAYCVVMIISGLLQTEPIIQDIADYYSEIASLTGQQANVQDVEQLTKIIYFALFGAVIVTSILVQGLTALYYFTRARHIRGFTEKTPPWVIELLKAV